jgi:hypothetical protein
MSELTLMVESKWNGLMVGSTSRACQFCGGPLMARRSDSGWYVWCNSWACGSAAATVGIKAASIGLAALSLTAAVLQEAA